ncbi:head completion/stabilization protein [Atlantibacter hermannii]|uniref:head completion/stabilization protein n=3 Tax=Atlantibacter hermannii TaxID=565 RepID=UPI0028AF51DA|nr:head completion/stabilization protein [Atlantibacter hermannii]
MKFVSPEPVKDGAQDTIPNTFFWPAISLTKFREDMRTDGTVTPERLRQALLTAMAEVNADLYDFREKQQNRGCADLNSVPAEVIDGESQRVLLYRRAVFCWAKSNLVERYRDYDATGEGKKKADEYAQTADELMRDARWAISRLQDLPHMTVELI